MNIPANLRYTASHEWVELLPGNRARVGITDFAQESMGDIVFINLPAVGDEATAGEALCDIESVKAVEDVLSPLNGTVAAANAALEDAPETINADPYGAWIAELENVTGAEGLLDEQGYRALLQEA